MTDVETETSQADLCGVCDDRAALGRAGRGKMKSLCIECAAEMRDNGDCPVCRGVGVVTDKGVVHIAECTGKLPAEPKPRKTKAASKSVKEISKDHDAADRSSERRENGGTLYGVKNIRDMNLEELQARLRGTWIKVHGTTGGERKLGIDHVIALNDDEVEYADAKNKAVRTFDRTKILKLGPQRK